MRLRKCIGAGDLASPWPTVLGWGPLKLWLNPRLFSFWQSPFCCVIECHWRQKYPPSTRSNVCVICGCWLREFGDMGILWLFWLLSLIVVTRRHSSSFYTAHLSSWPRRWFIEIAVKLCITPPLLIRRNAFRNTGRRTSRIQTRFTGFRFDSCDKGWLDTRHHSEF